MMYGDSDGMLVTCLTLQILPSNSMILAGLSLYFEDGHDDLDDCEYTRDLSFHTNTLSNTWINGFIYYIAYR